MKSDAPPQLAMPNSREPTELMKPRHLRALHSFKSEKSSALPSPFQVSVPSPVDPELLKGASALARFGLDIGGTLCKVVYFEPFGSSRNNTSASKCDDLGSPKDGLPIFSNGNGPFGLANVHGSTESESADGFVDSRNRESNSGCSTKPNTCLRKGTLDNVFELEEQCVKTRVVDGQTRRFGTPRDNIHVLNQQKPLRIAGEAKGDKVSHSTRQARKMWVSSHEPIHLLGRGTLYFKCFETWRMEEFLYLTKEHSLVTGGRAIGATGGGARKFGDQFLQIAGLQLQRADELKSLVRGIDFLARHAEHEGFEYPKGQYQGGVIQRPWESPENSSDDGDSDNQEDQSSGVQCEREIQSNLSPAISSSVADPRHKDSPETRKRGTKQGKGVPLQGPILASSDDGGWLGGSELLYPYLVVNIGSGVSMLRADSADQFERVGGTSLGGSTFLGLTTALTGCSSFQEALDLAIKGDSTEIDMLVGDIYGGDYTEMGLAATTVAGSFGKLVQPKKTAAVPEPQHFAKAALLMVTNNIGSIAMLHARAAGVRHIIFTGSFLNNNEIAMRLLAVAMEFWSKGNMKAVFLRHEGHVGALGALLSALDSSNPIDTLLLD